MTKTKFGSSKNADDTKNKTVKKPSAKKNGHGLSQMKLAAQSARKH